MPAPRSDSFDRAAAYYDATRGLNPDAMQKVVALLTEEIGGRGPCLEVGIGTGRTGLTLWEKPGWTWPEWTCRRGTTARFGMLAKR
jgi:hypothetical protein